MKVSPFLRPALLSGLLSVAGTAWGLPPGIGFGAHAPAPIGGPYVPLSAAGASDHFFDNTIEQELFFNGGLLHPPVAAAPAPMSLNAIHSTGGDTIGHNEIDAALTKIRGGYSSSVLPTTSAGTGSANYGEYAKYQDLIGKYSGRYESRIRDSIDRNQDTTSHGDDTGSTAIDTAGWTLPSTGGPSFAAPYSGPLPTTAPAATSGLRTQPPAMITGGHPLLPAHAGLHLR